MTQIKPSYVTFEQAKKFKEKKIHRKFWVEDYYRYSDKKLFTFMRPESFDDDIHLFAPEQWWVVEWLRVVHGIWVYCEINGNRYYCKAKKLKSNWRKVVSGVVNNKNILYNSPQEAYSAAFDHVLNNLI